MGYLEIALVFILTAINGLLAMSELAIASSRIPRLRALAEQGANGARRALALASDPGRFLSTVQIGITLIGILAGAVSGAALGERVSNWFSGLGFSEAVADALGFGLVIGGITYLSLIIGELVPKQIALKDPERIACLVAPAMTILAKVAAPVVWLLSRSGHLILRLLGQSGAKDQSVTDAEIHSLIAEAEETGVIEPEERRMIAGVMRLGGRPVRAVMVPRADVQTLELSADLAEAGRLMKKSGHSRFVVTGVSQDEVLGVIQAKDIAAALLSRKKPTLKQLLRQAPVIPDKADALEAMKTLKASEVHMGLVHDEYGHFEGIVTSADILEAIAGSFRQEGAAHEEEVAERDDGSLLVAGWAPVELLTERLRIPIPAKRDYQTVAGFVIDMIGRMPKTGDSVERHGHRFEVVDLDGRRIDKVMVSRASPATRRAI
ncbi:MAG: HlyC/CorC family transporter [Rhizobiales bacterium]|nr:HlyC/CorC family transporter [Hyphomicrobiales bacterium]